MAGHFGHDFSRIRVHADTRAADSANAIGAVAYTYGHDLVFAAGRYRPGTHSGLRLLAHELAHAVQQDAGGGSLPQGIGATSERAELEAERASLSPPVSILQEPRGALFVRRQGVTPAGPTDPFCQDLLAQIIARVVELKERADALVRNPLNLPATGTMSVAGHREQFQNKQANLRSKLNEWNTNNCGPGLPAEAWSWATRPIPTPAPAPPSPRMAEAPADGAHIETKKVLEAAGATAGVAIGGYIVYRVIRMLPSLLPPLWWTIPANVAVP